MITTSSELEVLEDSSATHKKKRVRLLAANGTSPSFLPGKLDASPPSSATNKQSATSSKSGGPRFGTLAQEAQIERHPSFFMDGNCVDFLVTMLL